MSVIFLNERLNGLLLMIITLIMLRKSVFIGLEIGVTINSLIRRPYVLWA